jgi:hypothetical protein
VIPDRWLRSAIATTTLLAGALFALDLGGPIRYVVVIAFVMACPGLAWARLLRLGDAADLAGIGMALSIALTAVVAQTMALARWWSPGVGYLVLAALTVAGLSFEPRVPAEDEPAGAADPS